MRCFLLLILSCAAAMADWNKVEFGSKTLLPHPKCEALLTAPLGPFAKRGDGGVLDDFLPRRLSGQTYRARWMPKAAVKIDGRADEAAWSEASVEKNFIFPWKKEPAPATEFRALCDETRLCFTFRMTDADIVALDKMRDEQDAVFEDRGELYFSRDDVMRNYYCMEVNSRGRAFDYRGAYYRHLDPSWNCAGLETAGSPLPDGYVVEDRIPLASFEAAGFPRLRPGVKIRCGIFRAEFSRTAAVGRWPSAPASTIATAGSKARRPSRIISEAL